MVAGPEATSKLTGNPDVADAVSVMDGIPASTGELICAKLIVCDCGVGMTAFFEELHPESRDDAVIEAAPLIRRRRDRREL